RRLRRGRALRPDPFLDAVAHLARVGRQVAPVGYALHPAHAAHPVSLAVGTRHRLGARGWGNDDSVASLLDAAVALVDELQRTPDDDDARDHADDQGELLLPGRAADQ